MKTQKFVLALIAVIAFGSLSAQKLMTRNGNVKFFSDAAIEDIEAINNQVSSVLDLETGEFAFLVPIKGFMFEKALMQEHFNENYMESSQYPSGSFKGTAGDLSKIDLSKDGSYDIVFSGVMNIHGTDREIKEKATITVKDGKANLTSVFRLEPEAYGVQIPASKRDNIAKSLEVTVNMNYDKK